MEWKIRGLCGSMDFGGDEKTVGSVWFVEMRGYTQNFSCRDLEEDSVF